MKIIDKKSIFDMWPNVFHLRTLNIMESVVIGQFRESTVVPVFGVFVNPTDCMYRFKNTELRYFHNSKLAQIINHGHYESKSNFNYPFLRVALSV